MNILFLTIGFPESTNNRNIYTDLMEEFKCAGNNVYIATARERKYKKNTELIKENGLNILRIRTGNMQKTNFFEKGITTIRIEGQFIRSIKKHFKHVKFDLVLYSTPPITFSRVIEFIKSRDNALSYLLLKDIFPQNAVDIGIMKENSVVYRFFRKKEVKLYKASDFIGCMSEANVDFILKHNDFIERSKVEVCPNSIKPINVVKDENEENIVKNKYGIPTKALTFLYGGNLGKPQGIEFLIQMLDSNKNREDVFFLIVGSGTEYTKLQNFMDENKYFNMKLYNYMSKEDFDELVKACDVGMIFLDRRFTIPNFPSRLLTYQEFSKPVIAATDPNTDIGSIIEGGEFGFWCISGELEEFNNKLNYMITNKDVLEKMGINSRRYLENHYTVSIAREIIMNHFKIDQDEDNNEI